jgi:hypothetical protein
MAGKAKEGEGYAVANLSDLGEGPGFRKIRSELGVTAFGVNARVDAPTQRRLRNLSDSEEAVYFVVGGKDGYVGRDDRLSPGETHR